MLLLSLLLLVADGPAPAVAVTATAVEVIESRCYPSASDAPEFEGFSGLDDVYYSITLYDVSTGLPFTSGSVSVRLCAVNTATALGGLSAASQALAHSGAGRWIGVHDSTNVSAALATLTVGQRFDRCLVVTGLTAGRRIAQCKRVLVVAG